jgi:hypothetical protein
MKKRGVRFANFAPGTDFTATERTGTMCSSIPRLAALLTALVACAQGVYAETEANDTPDTTIALPGKAPATEAPRFTRSDLPIDAQASLPGYRSEVSEFSYRWWASRGRADVGLGVGALTYTSRPNGTSVAGANSSAAPTSTASGTVLTLGMRYRASDEASLFADAAGVRGTRLEGGDVVVGKVGVEFKSAQSRWNLTYGGLGMQMTGDTRMTLRLRRGGLGLYMHREF